LQKAEQGNNDMPTHLAFLTMTQHQLGMKDEAKATLARLREVMKQERWAKDADAHDLLREGCARRDHGRLRRERCIGEGRSLPRLYPTQSRAAAIGE
jgi:hypothetical protein